MRLRAGFSPVPQVHIERRPFCDDDQIVLADNLEEGFFKLGHVVGPGNELACGRNSLGSECCPVGPGVCMDIPEGSGWINAQVPQMPSENIKLEV